MKDFKQIDLLTVNKSIRFNFNIMCFAQFPEFCKYIFVSAFVQICLLTTIYAKVLKNSIYLTQYQQRCLKQLKSKQLKSARGTRDCTYLMKCLDTANGWYTIQLYFTAIKIWNLFSGQWSVSNAGFIFILYFLHMKLKKLTTQMMQDRIVYHCR